MKRILPLALVAVALMVGAPTIASAQEPSDVLLPFTDTLTCGQEITKDDQRTGRLELRFLCLADRGVVNWAFTLSPQVRAMIGPNVEPAAEDGMAWWRNGASQPKNTEHRRASTYQFHGTLNPVGVNEKIDYMDNFRFTTSDGRRGNVVVAGTLNLKP